MTDNLITGLAALGIAIAPALLKFAGGETSDANLVIDDGAIVQCVSKQHAPVHQRYQGRNDIEARLPEGSVVQILSKRKNWRRVAYLTREIAETGWMITSHLDDCADEDDAPPSGGHGSPSVSDGFRIATFNIQNFGKTKLQKPDVVTTLTGIVQRYPLVAVQELSDKTNQVAGAFLATLNARGRRYDMLVSERTGRDSDDESSQEQYAYYFDSEQVEALSDGMLYDDRAHDFFQREPYLAQFKVLSGGFTFVIITVHTKPGVLGEIEHLDDVVRWAKTKFSGEDDFILLGDFNAGCSYAAPEDLDELSLRSEDYVWVVPDDADTNLASKACAYDRIVITENTSAELTGAWAVDTAFSDKAISDHWPVWAAFHPNER